MHSPLRADILSVVRSLKFRPNLKPGILGSNWFLYPTLSCHTLITWDNTDLRSARKLLRVPSPKVPWNSQVWQVKSSVSVPGPYVRIRIELFFTWFRIWTKTGSIKTAKKLQIQVNECLTLYLTFSIHSCFGQTPPKHNQEHTVKFIQLLKKHIR